MTRQLRVPGKPKHFRKLLDSFFGCPDPSLSDGFHVIDQMHLYSLRNFRTPDILLATAARMTFLNPANRHCFLNKPSQAAFHICLYFPVCFYKAPRTSQTRLDLPTITHHLPGPCPLTGAVYNLIPLNEAKEPAQLTTSA